MNKINELKTELDNLTNALNGPIIFSFVAFIFFLILMLMGDDGFETKMICFICAFLLYSILVIYYNIRKNNINNLIETEQTKLYRTETIIKNYSEKYLEILQLNKCISYNNINSIIEIKANAVSKKQFDNYDYDYILNDYLNNNKQFFNELCTKVNLNKNIKNNYDGKYYAILNKPSRIIKSNVDIYDRDYYLQLETDMLKKLYLNIIDNVNYKIIVNYISPDLV